MTNKNNYDVRNDIFYTNFINSKKKVSKTSIRNYVKTLNKFTTATNTTLETIINNCRNQQEKVTEIITSQGTDENGNQIIEKRQKKFNVNSIESYSRIYLDSYINYCKNIGNKNTTINQDIILIRAFLKHYDIELPKLDTLENDASKWYLLSKEDFKFVMADSTITHASLIKFLQSTGMRLSDALSLTIGDYMEATKDYHSYVDIDDFIDNAPQDMIGSWYFHPSKTRRYDIRCQTFNDPETNNLILQNLRKIKNEYIPRINKKKGLNLRLTKDDALFGSQKANYKGKISYQAIINSFIRKNNKLKAHHTAMIKEAISNNEISAEDYGKEVSKIPRFHAHACRKYFETIIARNCGDLRICTLMEGHISPVATDASYIKKNMDEVKEYYLSALDDLSLEKAEVKVYTSSVRKEMESKIGELERKNEKLENEVSEINNIKERLKVLESNRPSWEEFIKGG